MIIWQYGFGSCKENTGKPITGLLKPRTVCQAASRETPQDSNENTVTVGNRKHHDSTKEKHRKTSSQATKTVWRTSSRLQNWEKKTSNDPPRCGVFPPPRKKYESKGDSCIWNISRNEKHMKKNISKCHASLTPRTSWVHEHTNCMIEKFGPKRWTKDNPSKAWRLRNFNKHVVPTFSPFWLKL